MEQQQQLDLSNPWDMSDIAFVLDGNRRVHVNKTILSMSSEVFKKMFNSDFKEKKLTEIPLPGKSFGAFIDLMKIVHPPNKDVKDTNVYEVLPLAHEYAIHHVVTSCETQLLSKPPSVRNLVLADVYSLMRLHDSCMTYMRHTPLTKLRREEAFNRVNPDTMVEILLSKLRADGKLQSTDSSTQTDFEALPIMRDITQDNTMKTMLVCELMSKPPGVKTLVEAEKHGVHPLKKTCIDYIVNNPVKLLPHEYLTKVSSASLAEIIRERTRILTPRLSKLARLEQTLAPIAAILQKVKDIENGKNKKEGGDQICSNVVDLGRHTMGKYAKGRGCQRCVQCEAYVGLEIKNMCLPMLQLLSRIN